ncbi:hypothetical protein [Clostridium sp.]|uniref:hypothetical protein n=1 Tax=Clostridium sp. TaxID=1506 RepID=UPI0032178BB0
MEHVITCGILDLVEGLDAKVNYLSTIELYKVKNPSVVITKIYTKEHEAVNGYGEDEFEKLIIGGKDIIIGIPSEAIIRL